jgi:hypothetical protein
MPDTVTSQSSSMSILAARRPTAPAPTITTRRPFRPISRASSATVVAAVVLQPFESSIADTRNGPKNAFSTAARTSSPAPTLEPPTHTARLGSPGARVKNADCTRLPTASGSTPPYPRSSSVPASCATIASNVLGCGSVSSWIRIFFTVPPRPRVWCGAP